MPALRVQIAPDHYYYYYYRSPRLSEVQEDPDVEAVEAETLSPKGDEEETSVAGAGISRQLSRHWTATRNWVPNSISKRRKECISHVPHNLVFWTTTSTCFSKLDVFSVLLMPTSVLKYSSFKRFWLSYYSNLAFCKFKRSISNRNFHANKKCEASLLLFGVSTQSIPSCIR